MAQNLQDMINKLKASQKVNQMTSEQKDLAQKFYERTQPIAWQGAISWLSSSQKRKLRWSNVKDAVKWAASSLYGAAEFIPWTLAKIGAAWVDQLAWTYYQSKIDDSLNYIPAKLRKSSNNTKAFDKWQEYANDALMATALLTAWSSSAAWAKWNNVSPKFTKSKINPWTDILKWEDYPAFAQKRYNDWRQSVTWKPAKSEPEWLYYMWTKESAPNKWLKLTQENITNNNILKKAWYSDEEIFAMKPSERAEIVNRIEAEYIETWPHADAVERWLYEFSDAENAAANTSRARAAKTKAKNMSAAERAKRVAAEEWASDSKWEIDAEAQWHIMKWSYSGS